MISVIPTANIKPLVLSRMVQLLLSRFMFGLSRLLSSIRRRQLLEAGQSRGVALMN
jgi:hypothetical protein